jgi:hypothetical protein
MWWLANLAKQSSAHCSVAHQEIVIILRAVHSPHQGVTRLGQAALSTMKRSSFSEPQLAGALKLWHRSLRLRLS